MRTNLADRIVRLTKALEEYFFLRLDLVKLTAMEKITKVMVLIISSVVTIVLSGLFLLFASAAFVVWYGQHFGDYLMGLFIVSGFIILLNIIFYVFRGQLITSSIIKALSRIFFNDEED